MARGFRATYTNWQASVFGTAVILAGVAALVYGAAHPASHNIAEFICYSLIAILASRLRVNLPAMADTLSVNFLFVLVAVLELSFTEALLLGCAGVIIQSFYAEKREPIRITFNICSSALATALAYEAVPADMG